MHRVNILLNDIKHTENNKQCQIANYHLFLFEQVLFSYLTISAERTA